MIFNRKKKQTEELLSSFGELKDASCDFNLIERYFRNKDHSKSLQVLSDKTCNDLDFEDLFMFLDRTSSKPGQQFLYNRLREIPTESHRIKLDEKLIERFSADEHFRVMIQTELKKLDEREAYYIPDLFQEAHLEKPRWFFVMPMLSFASILSVILMPFNFNLLFVIIGVFIINICFHLWNKKNLSTYSDSIPQLLQLKRVASILFKYKELQEINPNLRKSINIIDQVKYRMKFFKLEYHIQGELQVVFWSFMELFKILFLLEPLLLFGVLKRLDTRREEIEKVYSFVGRIDMLISIASLRKGEEVHCMPKISEENTRIVGDQIYHPLIVDCVTNQIDVNDKSVLLTGSNMSGKTTFIRAIGINAITGLTINTCFAKTMQIPRIRIYSAIRINDDLLNDKSYYFEEVLTIKNMIDKANTGQANLFLLDEIFKGTNTVERISAGKAVLSSLSKHNNMVFVSTHDIELTDLLDDEYELYHFSEIVTDKSVDFDYKLKNGQLKNRNAIRILQINDYPEDIIREAMSLSEELDNSYSKVHV